MKRTFALAICVVLIAAVSAFASGGKEPAGSAGGKPFEGVTVSIVNHSGEEATPWYTEAPAIKEKLGITINVIEVTPDELYSRELLELTHRTGAFDVIQYNSAWIGDYEPYILPLDDYVAADKDAIGYADILPAFNKAQNFWGGKKMSVTQDGDTFLLYYRKDLFSNAEERASFKAKFGYELPNPPTTWSQVVDIAKFFTRSKGQKLAGQTLTKDFYGYSDQAKRGRVYYWYLFRYVPFSAPNPHYFDPATMKPLINSPGAVKALENMKSLLPYSPPGALSWEWDELWAAAFKEGSVAMWIHWTDEGRQYWDLGALPVENPPKADLGIATCPGVETNGKLYQYTIVDSAWVASVVKDSKNPKAAYAVLRYMFGPGPVGLKYVMGLDQIAYDPYRKSQFESKEWRAAKPGIETYLTLELKALENEFPMLKLPGAFEYNDVLDLNVSKYLAGDFASARDALDAVARRWSELNEKFGVDKQKSFYAKMWQ